VSVLSSLLAQNSSESGANFRFSTDDWMLISYIQHDFRLHLSKKQSLETAISRKSNLSKKTISLETAYSPIPKFNVNNSEIQCQQFRNSMSTIPKFNVNNSEINSNGNSSPYGSNSSPSYGSNSSPPYGSNSSPYGSNSRNQRKSALSCPRNTRRTWRH